MPVSKLSETCGAGISESAACSTQAGQREPTADQLQVVRSRGLHGLGEERPHLLKLAIHKKSAYRRTRAGTFRSCCCATVAFSYRRRLESAAHRPRLLISARLCALKTHVAGSPVPVAIQGGVEVIHVHLSRCCLELLRKLRSREREKRRMVQPPAPQDLHRSREELHPGRQREALVEHVGLAWVSTATLRRCDDNSLPVHVRRPSRRHQLTSSHVGELAGLQQQVPLKK